MTKNGESIALWSLFYSLLIFIIAGASPARADTAPVAAEAASAPFTQTQCQTCHKKRDPALTTQWRAGPHAAVACLACHGDRHGALPAARQDAACTGCHGGATEHSYAVSKHGVIVILEQTRWDWTAPLARGNYRAPGCAYCHLHDGDHGNTMDAARGRHVREWICGGCHAPRYVADQFAAGTQLLEIGRLKAEEAASIAARHPQGPKALAETLELVQKHLRHLRLGAGHHSPDYQWWHGQPALDGDLIRLRDAVARALRRNDAAESVR
ncbi:MAG: hypothetical protein GY862_30465 [Gammaproteobacteria bacterium]|nr:hypothetical protein [Gammaproteobacteria bacterium]